MGGEPTCGETHPGLLGYGVLVCVEAPNHPLPHVDANGAMWRPTPTGGRTDPTGVVVAALAAARTQLPPGAAALLAANSLAVALIAQSLLEQGVTFPPADADNVLYPTESRPA